METKTTNTSKKGAPILEILLIALILIVIIVLFNQNKSNINKSKVKSTEQSTIEYPTTTSTSTTTTTTTTTTGGGTVSHTNQPPSITLYGDNPYSIYHPGTIQYCEPGPTAKCPPRTDIYIEPGYKATDKEDGDITSKVVVTDETNRTPDNGPCHSYNKKYTVTDSGGSTSTVKRVVNECNGL
jgi:hypothetical protein